MSDEDDLSLEEKRLAEFYNKVNSHLQQISLQRHGELISADETVAHAIFWTQVLDTHFPELIPVCELLAKMIIIRGDRVANAEEGDAVRKRYLN